jgi:propanediol dehydratase large subunit
MKSMGGDGVMVTSGVVAPDEALRYAMSLPVATTVSGICSFEILQQNLKVARGFTPMSASEMQQLRKRCASAAADGRFEMYKTTAKFEGPEGRRQHGFPPHSELPV